MKEHQHTEWKETWRDEYLRWICGFANAEGGVLVIGRNDQGVSVGAPNADKLLQDLPNKVRDVLGIMVAVNLVKEGGKDLIEIRVEPYRSPISYKGEYHYRMAGLMPTFRANPEHLIKAGEGAESTPEMPGKTAQEMSGEMSGEIVDLIAKKPDITIPELAAKLKRTERTIERLINRLKAEKAMMQELLTGRTRRA